MGIVKIKYRAVVLFVLGVFLKLLKGIVIIFPDNEHKPNLVQRIQVLLFRVLDVIVT